MTDAAAWTAEGHRALGRPALERVRALELHAARAWPALERQRLGGWVLRAAGGVSRRSNSAWPRAGSTLTTEQLVRAAVAWYAERGLPPTIQLSPADQPADLAEHLHGWAVGGETLVLEGPVRRAARDGVTVSPVPTEDWWAVASATAPRHFAGPHAEPGRAMLQAVALPCGYAVGRAGAVPVAVGRAVVDGDHAGIFSMGTLAEHRGAGHGRAVLDTLCAWAAGAGATTAWLQVEAGNDAARRLYAGLRPVYSYAYATRP